MFVPLISSLPQFCQRPNSVKPPPHGSIRGPEEAGRASMGSRILQRPGGTLSSQLPPISAHAPVVSKGQRLKKSPYRGYSPKNWTRRLPRPPLQGGGHTIPPVPQMWRSRGRSYGYHPTMYMDRQDDSGDRM